MENENPNPKTVDGSKAFYGNGMMAGMYPGAGNGHGYGISWNGRNALWNGRWRLWSKLREDVRKDVLTCLF